MTDHYERPGWQLPIETEWKLRIHYDGVDGVEGVQDRELGVMPYERVHEHAVEMIEEHAGRVEVFSRTVQRWSKLDELRRLAKPSVPPTDPSNH